MIPSKVVHFDARSSGGYCEVAFPEAIPNQPSEKATNVPSKRDRFFKTKGDCHTSKTGNFLGFIQVFRGVTFFAQIPMAWKMLHVLGAKGMFSEETSSLVSGIVPQKMGGIEHEHGITSARCQFIFFS